MTARGRVEMSVTIQVPAEAVWRALTEPDLVARWMGGARVESSWAVSSDITFTGSLAGKPYHDRGTVRAFEPPRLLCYDHWSRFSRLPDAPENRSVITLRLQPEGGDTRLSVRHEHPVVEAMAEHAAHFWRVALGQIKGLAESGGS